MSQSVSDSGSSCLIALLVVLLKEEAENKGMFPPFRTLPG